MKKESVADGVQEVSLDSWHEFFNLANDLFAQAPAFVYRGQRDYDWLLKSSLDRWEEKYPYRKNLSGSITKEFLSPPLSPEDQLKAFKNAIRGRRGPNPPWWDDPDDWWALGQHHGLKTPLLDLTRSPYVALFFAFEEEKSDCQESKYRGVYALSSAIIPAKGSREASNDSAYLVSSDSDANSRLISQAGLFVKLPEKTELECHIRQKYVGDVHRTILTKIKILDIDRHDCLVALNKMNINYMTLFPDIEGAAKHVNSLWQPGHEDSIAYV